MAAPTSFDDVLRTLLRTAHPYSEMFTDAAQDRFILAPVYDSLNEESFEALRTVANAHDETEMFWGIVGDYPAGPNDYWPQRPIISAKILPIEYRDYAALPTLQEASVLMSTRGTWVVLIDHDWYAVAAGRNGFAAELRARMPAKVVRSETDQDDPFNSEVLLGGVGWLVREVAAQPTQIPALRTMLEHVCGVECAHELLSGVSA